MSCINGCNDADDAKAPTELEIGRFETICPRTTRAAALLSTSYSHFGFGYGDFGSSVEGNILTLAAAAGFDPTARSPVTTTSSSATVQLRERVTKAPPDLTQSTTLGDSSLLESAHSICR
jgi:hypothetical protein